jgi:hypothetical protein
MNLSVSGIGDPAWRALARLLAGMGLHRIAAARNRESAPECR